MTRSAALRELQCMEIWGGNTAASSGVSMPGMDAWVHARPAPGSDAGGDLHYVSSCAGGRIARFLLADVSGHGEAVAGMADALRSILRRNINRADQTDVVASVNQEFARLQTAGGFATSIAATWFAPHRTLALSVAGHPPPLVYEVRRRSWRWLEVRRHDAPQGATSGPSNLPLGVSEPTRYDDVVLELAPGDLVLFYTDALFETPAPDGRRLGRAGLIDWVAALPTADPGALVAGLAARVDGWAGAGALDDDLSIMLLRPNGGATRATIPAQLRGLARTIGEIAVRPFGGAPWPELSRRTLRSLFDRPPP